MRLFTGISVDESAIPRLAELRAAADINWTPSANLHVTTKFIGEWTEARLPELQTALAGISWPGKVTLTLSGFELLPRLVLAAVTPDPALAALVRDTEETLEALGCPREDRPYRPHVTLARMRKPAPLTLRETIASMTVAGSSFEALHFHLYLSRASVYTKLASYP